MAGVPQGAVDRLRRIGGDKLLVRILEMFLERSVSLADNATGARASGDGELLARSAHSLKSAAANLELEALRSLAFELELAATHEDEDAINGALARLPAAVSEANATVHSTLSEIASAR